MRYLQVWAADRAGNISLMPKRSFINYTPAAQSLAAGAVQVLRYDLNAGDRLSVRVQPSSGDPDLYLWAPDALSLPRAPWYSNQGELLADALNVLAPVAGSYQLEIVGYTAAEYTLDVQITPAALGVAEEVETAGLDAQKPVRSAPVIAPALLPGEQYAVPPAAAPQAPNNLYLPAVQR